jgi:hypothetical protein
VKAISQDGNEIVWGTKNKKVEKNEKEEEEEKGS